MHTYYAKLDVSKYVNNNIIMIMGDYNIKLKDIRGTVPHSKSYRLNYLFFSILDSFIKYIKFFVGLINEMLHVKSHVIDSFFHFFFLC